MTLLLDFRLPSFVIQPWLICVLCVWTHGHIWKRHQNRTWNTVELDIIQFVLRGWRSESCTEYWLWCAALCVGVDRTVDVSTDCSARECSLPWHVWIDLRTSVKCVKGIKGSCAHLVRLQSWCIGLSCYITDYICLWFNRDGFVCVCLDTNPHTESTPKPDLKHSRTWYHTICFEKLEEWVLYSVLTLMCCFVCGCGPYGWRLYSTFSVWVFPPLTRVWSVWMMLGV
jgi:hypothetical protein